MVLTAATSPDEVPVPTNSSTRGTEAPAATARAASTTEGGVGRWDAVQFDEPHPVEMIKASKTTDTMSERDTGIRWVRWKCTNAPLTSAARGRAQSRHIWDFYFDFQEDKAVAWQFYTRVLEKKYSEVHRERFDLTQTAV